MAYAFVVTKNSDFTEGRGVQQFDRVYTNWAAANDYVMDQPGIMGTVQKQPTIHEYVGGETAWRYDGYVIQQVNMLKSYDANEIAQLRREAESIRIRLKELDRLIKKG